VRFGAESASSWVCVLCRREIAAGDGPATCAECGPHGTLDIRIDYESIERAGFRLPPAGWADQWAFAPLLPIPDVEPSALRVGATWLTPVAALARCLGIAGLWIKDESRNPPAR
jgi:hypothetical protein